MPLQQGMVPSPKGGKISSDARAISDAIGQVAQLKVFPSLEQFAPDIDRITSALLGMVDALRKLQSIDPRVGTPEMTSAPAVNPAAPPAMMGGNDGVPPGVPQGQGPLADKLAMIMGR